MIYFVRYAKRGNRLKTLFLVKTLFPPLDLCSYYILIYLVQPELYPLVERGMDLSYWTTTLDVHGACSKTTRMSLLISSLNYVNVFKMKNEYVLLQLEVIMRENLKTKSFNCSVKKMEFFTIFQHQ